MAIKSQHYLFTFHPIKRHIFLSKLYLIKKNSSILAILFTAIQIFQKPVTYMNKHSTLLIKLYVSLTYSVAFMKYCCYLIKLKKMIDNLMIQAGLDFHYMFLDI